MPSGEHPNSRKNLKSADKQTPRERQENGKKGAQKTHEIIHKKKTLREIAEAF